MNRRVEAFLSVTLVLAATVMAAALARREFVPQKLSSQQRPTDAMPPQFVPGWEVAAQKGIAIGDSLARIKLVEFSDFECPFCKRFHDDVLRSLQEKYGNDLTLIYVHFPIPSHRFAIPAALASECAHDAGRFERMMDLIFEKQDSLGLKSWTEFAADAGIRDTSRFQACVSTQRHRGRVDSASKYAQSLGVRGTPAIMLNGWLFSSPPSEELLNKGIASLVNGQKPYIASPIK